MATVPTYTKRYVIARDGRYCRYCGRSVQERKRRGSRTSPRADDLTIDHVIPRSVGGSSQHSNLVVACRQCNEGKAAKVPSQKDVDRINQNVNSRANMSSRAYQKDEHSGAEAKEVGAERFRRV